MNTLEEGQTHVELKSHSNSVVVAKLAANLQTVMKESGIVGIPEDHLRKVSQVIGVDPGTYPVNTVAQIIDSFLAGGFWMNDTFVGERGMNILGSATPQFLTLYTAAYNLAPALYISKVRVTYDGEIVTGGTVGVRFDELALRACEIEQESENESRLKQERDQSYLDGVHEFAHMGFFARLSDYNSMQMDATLSPSQTPSDLYDAQHHEFHALRWQLRAAQAREMDPEIVAALQERIRKAEQIRASS